MNNKQPEINDLLEHCFKNPPVFFVDWISYTLEETLTEILNMDEQYIDSIFKDKFPLDVKEIQNCLYCLSEIINHRHFMNYSNCYYVSDIPWRGIKNFEVSTKQYRPVYESVKLLLTNILKNNLTVIDSYYIIEGAIAKFNQLKEQLELKDSIKEANEFNKRNSEFSLKYVIKTYDLLKSINKI